MGFIVKILATIILNLITLGAMGFAIYAYFNPISGTFYFTNSDALMHVTGFAIVSCLLVFTLPSVKHRYLIFWMCSLGVLAEMAQPLLTRRRELSISDIGANGIGVLLGIAIATALIYLASHLASVMKKKAGVSCVIE